MKIPGTEYVFPDYYINHVDDDMVPESFFKKGFIKFPAENYHLATYDEFTEYNRTHGLKALI